MIAEIMLHVQAPDFMTYRAIDHRANPRNCLAHLLELRPVVSVVGQLQS